MLIRGLIRDVDADCLVSSIENRIKGEYEEKFISIKRRVYFDGNVIDSMEFTFMEKALPEIIKIRKFELPIS